MLHFLYSGSAYAPTGISSYIRSFMNKSSISVYTTDSKIYAAQAQNVEISPKSVQTKIRLLLWRLAEKFYFFFAIYSWLVHRKNARHVCQKLFTEGVQSSDIVVINDIWTLLEYNKNASLDNVYFVFHCNGDLLRVFTETFPSCKSQRFKKLIDHVYDLISEAKGVVFLTEQAQSIYLKRDGANLNSSVINNGFGESVTCNEKSTLSSYDLVCTGTVCRRKRQYLLPLLSLDKLSLLSSIRIIGDGPAISELKEQVNISCLSKFRLEGKVNKPFESYSFGDIFILLSSDEGMPVAAIEAMSKGCILVMTNVGGASELVKENGLLVSNISEEQILHDVEEFLESIDGSPELRAEMALKSIELFNKNFTNERMIRKYFNFLRV